MSRVNLKIGSTPNDSSNVWELGDVVSEICTEGEDANGYAYQETIGIATNQYGDYCIFRGSTDRETYEQCGTIVMSANKKQIKEALIKLVGSL